MFSLIVAVGENSEIGKNNQLLWHIPEDLKNFKKITTGKKNMKMRLQSWSFMMIFKKLSKSIKI